MAINRLGNKAGSIMQNSVKFRAIEHVGSKIYQDRIPAGMVLWSGPYAFINSYDNLGFSSYPTQIDHRGDILVNQAIQIPRPVSQLKTGIQLSITKMLILNAAYGYSNWSETAISTTSYAPKFQSLLIPKEGLTTGVKFAVNTFYNSFIQSTDETHLIFYRNQVSSSSNWKSMADTVSYWNDSNSAIGNGFRGLLVIDKITAY
ncbi:MAG TPA: hypothetical protein H9875_00355 [Candidatus Levilactobacillus faecigallinarum]|uniref:Uncharacterized protein n=1 Tax=Candidatus Levilactobacillus faecigallinarum TaxID=2838638 RepID=A0A9D1U552_9LACO|nr:hypothetical protein [Candidatus Levilactobacillus faecigallinarum]